MGVLEGALLGLDSIQSAAGLSLSALGQENALINMLLGSASSREMCNVKEEKMTPEALSVTYV